MKNQIKLFTLIFSALLIFSCKEKTDYSNMKGTHNPTDTIAHKIVIVEFVNAETYTYLNVDENGKKYWMAVPNRVVKIGDTYYYDGGMLMKDFESKTLNKKFDEIIFAEGIRSNPIKLSSGKQLSAEEEMAIIDKVKIDKAKNGISLAELFKDEKSYAGKSVIIRGLVVKVNSGIMDRNWVHIIDGTRFNTKSNLSISTTESIKVGDTLTFKGNVTLNKDFGKGYVYPILIEEGVLIK